MLESLFNKFEKRLQRMCFLVNMAKSYEQLFYTKPLVMLLDILHETQ